MRRLWIVLAGVFVMAGTASAQGFSEQVEADLEESRARLKKTYMERFGEILPPVQLVHLFQLENKAEAIFKHDLATHIPLLE